MMTEIMIRTSVGESFSYSNSEFEQANTVKESKMLIGDEIEDESTLSFNDKLDLACERSSESTICGSNSEDSVVSNLHLPETATDIIDDAQDSANSTIKSDTSCDDYEYLTTETTVINTTYNMISHPDKHNLEKVATVNHHSSSQTKEKTNDKSRVIVQILKSNLQDSTKAVSVNETKSPIENQSTHSFRDDVFKMLSKPQSTFEFGGDNSKTSAISNVFNSIHTSVKSVKTVTQIGSSRKIVRTRRKHGIASFYLYPKGPRLCDIKEVSSCLKSATISSLRILHYILYDKYGLCGSDSQILNTKRKISHFCGYPFDKDSALFKKRENSLLKIPVEMLRGVYEAVFGNSSTLNRNHMVDNLMAFFSNTELYSELVKPIGPNTSIKHIEPNSTVKLMMSDKKLPDKDYDVLKRKAKSGPLPVVLLKKLKQEDVHDFGKKLKPKRETEQQTQKEIKTEIKQETPSHPTKKEKNVVGDKTVESYALPAYILKGPGKKLKYFPAIVRNVKNAKPKDLNMLHYLLYGRMEPIKVCRRNILEFSGFLECQSQFISKVQDILKRMNQSEMFTLCKILCLRAKTNSRSLRIAKIMEYLKAPFNPFKLKSWQNFIGSENVVAFKNPQSKVSLSELKAPLYPAEEWSEPENAVSDGGFRLRDFRRICSNIECSAPSDLTELNDLLFMKPSDETEIHDKILNFTRFGFHNTSVHYYYRKTLLFYMGPCVVRKIAGLLDIENWNQISSHEDLSISILNFLMEKKNSESTSAQSALSPTFSRYFPSPENVTDNPGLSGNSSSFEISKQSIDRDATNHQESMFISTMSKSSVNSVMCSPNDSLHFDASPDTKNNSNTSSANYDEDDKIPLRDIIHHPSDQELKRDITDIIGKGLFSSLTLGDVVKQIYQLYPLFNLKYREIFIKTETRKMLSEMRQNAVQHIEQNSIRS